ncbi:YhdP family protein [Pseudazoarcus pumilus]|nr:YhdP family protein [Pseudazoarcus pumilus]
MIDRPRNPQDETEQPPRRVSGVGRIALRCVVVAFFVFALALLALREIVLPRADAYRDFVAERVSRAIGIPVTIESLSADWPGLRLRLDARGIVLGDPSGADALRLERIEARPGWSSLLRGEPYFERLDLFAPELNLVRDARGQVSAAGVVLGSGEGGGAFAGWLLRQGEIAIHDARTSWHDQLRAARVLRLDDVDLRVERIGARFRFGLTARAPAGVASAIELRGDVVSADPRDPQLWDGQLFVAVSDARLEGLTPWLDYAVPVSGAGDFEGWVEVLEGRPRSSTLDFAVSGFGARLHDALPALEAEHARGRLHAMERPEGYAFDLSEFELVMPDQRILRPGRVSLRLDGGANAQDAGTLQVDSLDLGVLADLAAHLPLPDGFDARLGEIAPRGRVDDFELGWNTQAGVLQLSRIAGRFSDIALRARDGLPGGEGFRGEISGDRDAGRFTLSAREAHAELPEVFPDPTMRFERFDAIGSWSRDDDGLAIHLDTARFENPDAAGEAHGVYRPGVGRRGAIDMTARLTRASGDAVWRYLPHAVNDNTRRWLQRSLRGARVHDARLALHGALDEFPFRDGNGRFLVTVDFDGGRLDYAPGWPGIDGIAGTIRFEGAGMHVAASEASIFGVRLSEVTADIPDLDARGAQVLNVRGAAHGPTADFLRFVSDSPVGARLHGFTDDMRAEGEGTLALSLEMPLRAVERTEVEGDFRFSGNRVAVLDWLPALEQARARVRFSEDSLRIDEGQARLLDEPVTLSAVTREDGRVRFALEGRASMRALRSQYDGPLMDGLSGTAPWQARIDAGQGEVSASIHSVLTGVSSSLPHPLNKRAEVALPLALQLRFAGAERNVSGRLGDDIGFSFDAFTDGDAWALARGGVGIGADVPVSAVGVALRARLDEFDLDAWRALQLGAVGEQGASLSSLDVAVSRLRAFGYEVADVELAASVDRDGWSGEISSDVARGRLAWHGLEEGAVQLRLEHLVLGQRAASDEQIARRFELDADASLPDMDVVAERFELRGIDLGRLELRAANRGELWLLDSVTIENEDATLTGSGRWRAGRSPLTEVALRLDSRDIGALLTRVGYPQVIRGGTAVLEGDLSWESIPTRVDYPTLAGRFSVEANDGRFSKLEPGVGRLLGVLSLQALPRRLKLDFSDVFTEGFAFDRVAGTVDVASGVMRSDDFEISGPAARIWFGGSADLKTETQDLKVVVQPTLSESVAVGAAAGLINPVAGVIAYLAQKVLSDPIERMFAYGYSITGTWADPQVETLPVGQGRNTQETP